MDKKTMGTSGRPEGSGRLTEGFPVPRKFSPDDICSLRKRLGKRLGLARRLSQRDLADILGLKRRVVCAWELGTKHPSAASRRLMEILTIVPEVAPALIAREGAWRKLLERKARKRKVSK